MAHRSIATGRACACGHARRAAYRRRRELAGSRGSGNVSRYIAGVPCGLGRENRNMLHGIIARRLPHAALCRCLALGPFALSSPGVAGIAILDLEDPAAIVIRTDNSGHLANRMADFFRERRFSIISRNGVSSEKEIIDAIDFALTGLPPLSIFYFGGD